MSLQFNNKLKVLSALFGPLTFGCNAGVRCSSRPQVVPQTTSPMSRGLPIFSTYRPNSIKSKFPTLSRKKSTSTQLPLSTSLSTLPPTKSYLVGLALFHDPLIVELPPKLLVLKRAATEDTLPNIWELPGGHIEASDCSILHAITREMQEETGFLVTEVAGQLDDMCWKFSDDAEESVQLNYVVRVDSCLLKRDVTEVEEVKLNPDEHSEYRWVEEGEWMELDMTGESRKVVKDAFRLVWSFHGAES